MQKAMVRPYHELANAIVVAAVNDYRNALDGISYNHKSPQRVIRDLEKFFRSQYFAILTKASGEYIIEKLKQEHLEKERSKNESNIETGNV